MNDTARKRLWEDYIRLRTADLREKLILEYAPLVKVVAGRLSMYLGYNVEYDDLVSYGIFGLIDVPCDLRNVFHRIILCRMQDIQ